MPVRELARRIGKTPQLTARDISLMRAAGLVEEKYRGIYRLAERFRPPPGATHVDFGTWSLRLLD